MKNNIARRTLRKGYSQRGADNGRPTFLPADRNVAASIVLLRMRLEPPDYCYDSGGAYWGCRQPGTHIFWAESLEDYELGQYARPPVGTIEMTVDARTPEEAWEEIKKILPNAVRRKTRQKVI